MKESSNPLWQIIVPCVWRGDTPVRTRHHRVWDEYVMKRTGGMTIHRPVMGKWDSKSGERFNERNIPVTIMCSEVDIKAIARFTLHHYEQEAVFYHKISDHATIIYR